MKKKLLLSTFALSALGAFAQLPDNSIAPDFTANDLNGTSQHLYDYLDQGYTVFLDISATWCAPCWSYHNSGALENLYDQYGPGTTENKVMVFMVEGDGTTTLSDLQGTGSNTQGNWVNGTPYPIMDNAGIADAYDIGYFPTIFKICPNRIVTEIGQKTTAQLWASVGSCQQAISPADGTLLPPMGSIQACQGTEVGLTARLQNLGTSPMTSATIEARQGSTVLGSTTWTGDLNTYDVALVDVTDFVAQSSTSITYQITSTDDNANNNSSTQSVTASSTIAPSTNVTFEIKTDRYGSETRWKLYKADGSVFAQGGPYTDTNNPVANTYNWTLDDLTCYRLQVTDAYGDGMCCNYGTGYFKVMVNGNVVLQGGQFAAEDNKLFKTDAAASIADHALDQSLNIYPNPSTGLVNVEYALDHGAEMQVDVLDVLGKVVMHRTIASGNGVQRTVLDLGDLANGTYLLKLNNGSAQAVRPIALSK